MTNRLIAAALVAAGTVAGYAAPAAVRSNWSYHQGNTLMAPSQQHRDGYVLGVLDGYIEAYQRVAAGEGSAAWLETCVSGGWTVGRTTDYVNERYEKSVREFLRPSASVMIDIMKQGCAAAK